MKEQDKLLLLKDLCARLPYGVKATTNLNGWNGTYAITGCIGDRIYLDCPIYDEGDDEWLAEFVKPYLRPMSSMTEEELKEFVGFTSLSMHRFICSATNTDHWYNTYEEEDWLNEHHFDYRGLIEKGLALEAPEGMYN